MGALAIIGCGFILFPLIIEHLPPPDMARTTDGIVVFTGELEREKIGWRLYRQGLAPKLHISGRYPGFPKNAYPPNITVDFATTTEKNVTLTHQWIQRNGLRSVRLVTSDYHMPRCWLLARNFWKGITIVPNPVSAPSSRSMHPVFKIFAEYIRCLGAIVMCCTTKNPPLRESAGHPVSLPDHARLLKVALWKKHGTITTLWGRIAQRKSATLTS